METFVFISHSTKDKEYADKVCEYLEEHGINCWISPRNIHAGDNYATQIVSALKTCEAVVFLASENTNASGHVSNEIGLAFDHKKTIIPFRIENFEFADEYRYFIGRKHWIEAHMDFDAGLSALFSTLKQIMGEPVSDDTMTEKKVLRAETKEQQKSGYDREQIVDILIEKSRKYPYNLAEKLKTEDKYNAFKKQAVQFQSEILSVYKQNKRIELSEDFIEEIVDTLSSDSGNCVQVHGLPGCGKNMLVQLAYFKMLDNFKKNKSDYLPIYISSSYYEKLPYSRENVYDQMKEAISREMQEYFSYINANPEVRPVLMMEAIREHQVSKIAPENVVFDLWKSFGRYNRILTIDKGLIKNRSRLKRVMPIVGDGKGYVYVAHSVPVDDERAALNMIDAIMQMYQYDLEARDVYHTLKRLKFPMLDIFLVRLVTTEMISSYDVSEIYITDMYEKLALSELYGDEEKLASVAEELFAYVFDEKYRLNQDVYNGALWSLPHKHNTYLEFLIAYYVLNKVRNYQMEQDYSFFRTMLTAMESNYIESFIKNDYVLQETFVDFIKDNYEIFDVRQKSNAAYWLGKMTYNNLVDYSLSLLSDEFARLKPLVLKNNKNEQKNWDNQFLFRFVCQALVSLGQANMMDEYLCVVVTNDIANAINRGTTMEYYGDNYQMAAHDAYSFDTNLESGEQVLKILSSRIEAALYGNSGRFVENHLVTLLTLLQARMEKECKNRSFDLMIYVKKAQKYLEYYQSRPKNISSGKLIFYFKSIQEDIEKYVETEHFDMMPMAYKQYRGLKHIKRDQWLEKNIEDPESISEHTFGTWLMAMMFLPEEANADGYCKREILDMLLIHDMAEGILGDQVTSLSEPKKDLKVQDQVLRKLFLKGTYPEMANMTHYYNVWTGYYNGLNINARIARDINLIQTVYTFCEYYGMYSERFSDVDVKNWMLEERNLKTEIGYQLFARLIKDNQEFKDIMKIAEQV